MWSVTAVSVSPSGASSVIEASPSPRVVPWLTMAMGSPSFAAWRTYRSPDITVSDEPRTISARACSTSR